MCWRQKCLWWSEDFNRNQTCRKHLTQVPLRVSPTLVSNRDFWRLLLRCYYTIYYYRMTMEHLFHQLSTRLYRILSSSFLFIKFSLPVPSFHPIISPLLVTPFHPIIFSFPTSHHYFSLPPSSSFFLPQIFYVLRIAKIKYHFSSHQSYSESFIRPFQALVNCSKSSLLLKYKSILIHRLTLHLAHQQIQQLSPQCLPGDTLFNLLLFPKCGS